MNHFDTLYRALIDYRKNTLDDRECKTQRSAVITANNEEDIIEITRKNCIVEKDWIEAIENGLVFIEKAIKEERQFIRSNGEVIPIEKVKRTSKDSVEHLARHSNLFTREPEEGEDLVPDQLYTVERLSDFAVYENRFLYMLLCYLRDFIGMRYEKIVELTNTYKGNMVMNKAITESNRRITYAVKLEEERKNDDYLRAHNSAQAEIDRILTIYKAVTLYLATPLMVEVGKSPMLKPPIVRTNVLKMNRNFNEALRLYEFIAAYDRDGYEIKTDVKTVSPFVGTVADEIAETVELSLFLAYEHGLGIKDHFKANYEREEEKRRKEEQQKLAEQIKNIGRHLKESGLSLEEYILLLEKRIRGLEKEEEALATARITIDSLQAEIENFKEELQQSQNAVKELGEEIVRLNQKYVDDMAAAEEEHKERVRALTEEHERRIDELQSEYEASVQALNEAHEEQIQTLNEMHESDMESLRESLETETNTLREQLSRITEAKRKADEDYARNLTEAKKNYQSELKRLNDENLARAGELRAEITAGVRRLDALKDEYKALEEKKLLADGRLNALRAEHGLMGAADDFSTKEKTDELERQYRVFKKFFKAEWRKTRRKIWQEIFSKLKSGMNTDEIKAETAEEKPIEQPTATEQSEAKTEEIPQTNTVEETKPTKEKKIKEKEENANTDDWYV